MGNQKSKSFIFIKFYIKKNKKKEANSLDRAVNFKLYLHISITSIYIKKKFINNNNAVIFYYYLIL